MNTINRNNYENYFLLWIDGELSQIQMEEMDQFIANNPDLVQELTLLQSAKLPLDESIIYPHKAGLLKEVSDEISIENFELFFLMYIDNELTKAQKADVELFVLQHPALQESFLLLQQTKLTPELVVFNNKEVLYRKEEKSTPVFFMRWIGIAVAASIIGLVVMLWLLIPQNNLKQPVTFSMVNRTISKPVGIKNTATSMVGKENIQQKNKVALLAAQQQNKAESIKDLMGKLEAIKKNQPEQEQVQQIASVNMEHTVKGSVITNDIIAYNSIQQQLSSIAVRINEEEALIKFTQKKQAEEEEQVQQSRSELYKELDTDDENKSLYIGALELNKEKLRGFFRKASNIFRSKNKSEEDGQDKK